MVREHRFKMGNGGFRTKSVEAEAGLVAQYEGMP